MIQESTAVGPADFGTRFSAFMIDLSILLFGQWVIFFALSRQLQSIGLTKTEPCAPESPLLCEGPSTTVWVILSVVLVVIMLGYHALFEGLRGATPGKSWMGLRVVGVEGAEPIGLARGAVRSLVRQFFLLSFFLMLDAGPLSLDVPALVFLVVPVLGLAGIALGGLLPSARSLHDLAAGSIVAHSTDLSHSTDLAHSANLYTAAKESL